MFFAIADCYRTGNGVEPSLAHAITWYHKAADELKDTEAMVQLASAYEQTNQHTAQALHYYQLAADMGHAGGQHHLGN